MYYSSMLTNTIELGCGLIGIGRPWGVNETAVPSEHEAFAFLDSAFAQSIRYFDTAPAYGSSEAKLGKWLTTLSEQQRDEITVATKFGENWSDQDYTAYTAHSYGSLVRSLDQSATRLKKIDVLQLHKTTPEFLKSDDLKRALQYAKGLGITTFGASVSDLETGELVCQDDQYEILQLPLNKDNPTFIPLVREAIARGKTVITNRPFNMGAVLEGTTKDRAKLQRDAFKFILHQGFTGIILTGTKSPEHLKENIAAYNEARDVLS